MIATHLNPSVRADTRFRLRLQAEAVQRLLNAKDARQLTFMAHFPHEVAKFRSRNSYGFQVHNTTMRKLFDRAGVHWDDEDEEKCAGVGELCSTTQARSAAGHVRPNHRFWFAFLA